MKDLKLKFSILAFFSLFMHMIHKAWNLDPEKNNVYKVIFSFFLFLLPFFLEFVSTQSKRSLRNKQFPCASTVYHILNNSIR